ncbi:MAG: hypothetical protein IJ262_02375 [Clostridia bacterium]|nr:hypothetical protein [Clostridia bacterium]
MKKVKSFFSDHKLSLFFFGFLMAYSFVISGNLGLWKVDSITYSFHVVDFSIGFCTKLLPGAVCNFLFDEITENKISIYLTVLIAICFFLIGVLLEKIIKETDKAFRKTLFILIMFFLTGPATFSIYTDAFCWLDFYWLFAAVIALLLLIKKQLYFLIVPLMLATVMVHFASILCYIPFVCIIMLYKISETVNKKEKAYLWIVWTATVVSALGLSLYMAVYETEHVKMTMEEMNELLLSRGVDDFKYYDFSFFRDQVADKMPEYYTPETEGLVLNIDMTQSPVKILIDMIYQQMATTLIQASAKGDYKFYIILLPLVIFIYKQLSILFKLSSGQHLKRFSMFCAGALLLVTLFFGIIFSTDTIRWISHSFTPFFAFFLYAFYKEGEEYKAAVENSLKKIPQKVAICYLAIYSISVN